MKLFIALLFMSTLVQADIKLSALPLGNAFTTNVNDSFPYVDSIAVVTRRLTLADFKNWILSLVTNSISVTDGGNTNYSILAANSHVRTGTALTAPRTYTLPLCTGGNIGEIHSVKNDSTQIFNLTLSGNGGDTIDHAPTIVLFPGGAAPVVCAVSGNWDIRQ